MAKTAEQPSESSSATAKDTVRALLLCGALILSALALWAVTRGALVWALALLPVAVLLWVLLTRPLDRPRDWLTENAFILITIPLMGWLLGALLLWLLVNTGWAAERADTSRAYAELTVSAVDLTAAVTAPAITLRDEPSALEFSFRADSAAESLPDVALPVTITLPSELAFAVAPGPDTRQFAIPLNGNASERGVAIVSSGEFTGLRAAVDDIAVALCPPGEACAPLSLPMRVEGDQGFAIRHFVNSTVDQASPLILLLLLLTPGLAALVQRLVADQQRVLRTAREDECRRLVSQLRDHLCVSDIDRAQGDRARLLNERYRDFEAASREMAEVLLQLARMDYPWPEGEGAESVQRQEWPDARVLEMGPRWPREFVAAAVAAWRRFNRSDFKPTYCAGRPYLEPIFDATIRPALDDHLDRVWTAAMAVNLDAGDHLREERARVDSNRFAPDVLPFRRRVVQPPPDDPYIISRRELATPFEHDDAQHRAEQKFLCDGQAFWPHCAALESDLHNPERNLIIQGAAGSGRTALATMLPHPYLCNATDLYVRPNADVTRQDILKKGAEQLLAFVLDQPLFLSRYADADKRALGDFLLARLNPGDVRAQIERRRQALSNRRNQSDSRLGAEQLKRFAEDSLVSPSGSPPDLDSDTWYEALLAAARILEYRTIVFLVDVDQVQNVGHLDRLYILLHEPELPKHDIFTWLFVNDDFPIRATSAGRERAHLLRLTWDADDLLDMMEWRFEKYLDAANLWLPRERRRALGRCFQDEEPGLKRLLESSHLAPTDAAPHGEYNPRRFMRFWRSAARGKQLGDLITADDVARAVSENLP